MNNINIFVAFVAGLLSFFSPCVFPMIPVFLLTLTQGGKIGTFLSTLIFCIGVTTAFVSLGTAASLLGQTLLDYEILIKTVLAIFMIILGILTLSPYTIPFLSQTFKLDTSHIETGGGFLKSWITGFAFGFGWSPCVGPILGGILSLAATEGSIIRGVILLTAYSAGICFPLLVFSLLDNDCLYNKIKKWTPIIEKVGGACLIALGVYTLIRI